MESQQATETPAASGPARNPWPQRIAILLLVMAALGGGGYLFVITQMTHHSPAKQAPAPVVATDDPVLDGIRRGVEFLRVHQEKDGHFSRGALDPKPAFTALVLDAMVKSPDGPTYDSDETIRRACEAILSKRQPDGGFYTPLFGLGNYCTSISLMALKTADGERFKEEIEAALAYVRKCQLGQEAGGQAGGFGYGGGGNADLSNTLHALEAMRQAGVKEDDPAIKAALKFIERCQNNSETNPDQAWASDDGGFIYRPGDEPKSKAGEITKADGSKGYKSYGLMSYAGLMSLLHAYVDKGDARVEAAMRWVQNNYNLDEHAGLGAHGVYYYYMVMAKALAAYGQREIVTADGVKHDWPRELAQTILDRQADDGSWRNKKSDRWMESDAVLVTAYMVRALTHCRAAMAADPRPGDPPSIYPGDDEDESE